VLSTKVGELFENGASTYDFSAAAVRASVERSLRRLQTDAVDLLFIHSDGADMKILDETDCVLTLQKLKAEGLVKAIGLSGKTVAGARRALDWADVLMVELHLDDRTHEPVIAEAAQRGIGVIVKKGLASGRLSARDAIGFVLGHRAVGSMVIGGLNVEHFRENIAAAESIGADSAA
jgi:aryl-alcohol dehydrogenase-like predicted oxidoreductase